MVKCDNSSEITKRLIGSGHSSSWIGCYGKVDPALRQVLLPLALALYGSSTDEDENLRVFQEEWKDDITFLSTQFCTRVGQSTSVVRSDCDQSNMQMSESCYNAYDGESELAHTDPLECESAIADPAQNFSCCGTDWQEETSSSRRF